MATAAQILTYEEWLKLPPVEDGTDEVVDGELRLVPTRLYPHAHVVANLISDLRGLPENAAIYGSGIGLMISREPLTCRSPDIAVYWREKMVIKDGLYWSAPDLIIEIFSPSENRRRKEGKLADYSAIGVPEVWLVSPEAEVVEILLLNNGKLDRTAILADGDLHPTRFPGVTVSVSDIFLTIQ
jgi:Uma2 family endonuclease